MFKLLCSNIKCFVFFQSIYVFSADDIDTKKEETQAQTVLTKFNSVLSEISNNVIGISVKPKVQEMLRIWRETNFGDYISEKRVFKGQNYKYYEEIFDNVLKKM